MNDVCLHLKRVTYWSEHTVVLHVHDGDEDGRAENNRKCEAELLHEELACKCCQVVSDARSADAENCRYDAQDHRVFGRLL